MTNQYSLINKMMILIVMRLMIKVPKPITEPFNARHVGFLERQHYNMNGYVRLIQSIIQWISVFNASKSYQGVICCPQYHRFDDDSFSPKDFEQNMKYLFGLTYIGSWKLLNGNTIIYHAWIHRDTRWPIELLDSQN